MSMIDRDSVSMSMIDRDSCSSIDNSDLDSYVENDRQLDHPVQTASRAYIPCKKKDSEDITYRMCSPMLDHSKQNSTTEDDLIYDKQRIVHKLDVDSDIPEPTPIEPNRMVIVDNVPLTAAPWYLDESFSQSLNTLVEGPKHETNQSNCKTKSPSLWFDPSTHASKNGTSESSICSRHSSTFTNETSYSKRWNERYQDLVQFKQKNQHCLVPLDWPQNPALGHWVKRQRYQYSLKLSGAHSNLTDEREEALKKLGFVWDSHSALWEERFNELCLFRERYGHCHVPARYHDNPKLSVWVKCQRRQYKLLASGQKSNMTQERMSKLRRLGLDLSPRQAKLRSSSL